MSSQNFRIFWDEAINQIKQEYISNDNQNDFEVWFGQIKYIEDNGTEIIVSLPSDFFHKYMISSGSIYKIQQKIKDLCGQDVSITPSFEKRTQKPENNLNSSDTSKESVPINGYTSAPLSDTLKNKNNKGIASDIIIEENETDDGDLNSKNNLKSVTITESNKKKHPQLREDYVFERFVVGENNEYAYSASMAAAKDPGKRFNPLLLYGGTGLGKTHLMQSVGNYIYNNPPEGKKNVNICYITAENFTNEFTKSLRDRTTESFKAKYREVDVLLLDDIHFFEKKEQIQKELFYTFEALFNRKSQMIFTCDRPPSKLNDIDERLKSRFNLGTPIDLQPPSYEMRIAILQKKLELKEKTAPEEVINYIAKNIQSNVRELEGCLNKLIGYAELLGRPLTLDIAKKQLSDNISGSSDENVTIDTILKVVCNYYNITIADIKGTSRTPKFANPRHIAVYLARQMTDRTFTEIAGELGGRDHTTIMNSNKKIEGLLKTDEGMVETLSIIRKKIKEYKNI